MSRKSALTHDVQDRISKLVNAGAPLPLACPASGISWNTAKGWIRRGRAGESPYAAFVEEIERAKAAFVCGSTMRITKAAESDWKAAAWLLERRDSRHFGPKAKVDAKVEHSGGVGIHFYVPSNGRDEDG